MWSFLNCYFKNKIANTDELNSILFIFIINCSRDLYHLCLFKEKSGCFLGFRVCEIWRRSFKRKFSSKKYFTQNNIQFEQNIGLFIDYSGTGHFLNYNKSSKVNETFSILIGQFFLDQSKSRLNPTKKQNRTRDLTSFTAFSRLSCISRV